MTIKIGLIVSLMALLVACGGNAPVQNTPSTVVTAVPTTVAVAPTATPLPPTATPVPPTATPSPTLAPTKAPAIASVCDHPYFPVKPNAQWQYRVTFQAGGIPPSTFTETRTSITPNSFVEHREYSNVKTDSTWNCTNEGLVSGQIGLQTSGANQFKLETVKVSGITIPPANRWTAGATWNSSYEVKGSMTAAAGRTVDVQGAVDIASKVVGQESVTVPAGTYNALKIDQTITMKMNGTTGGINVPINFTLQSTTWYVQNVGRVKDVTSSEGALVATTELVSFTQ